MGILNGSEENGKIYFHPLPADPRAAADHDWSTQQRDTPRRPQLYRRGQYPGLPLITFRHVAQKVIAVTRQDVRPNTAITGQMAKILYNLL